MQIKRNSLLLGLMAGAALLSGCSALSLTNLTPSTLQENSSEIYTFNLRVVKNIDNVVPDETISPHVVVDGQDFRMKQNPALPGYWEFDYQLPPGRDEIAYYYLVQYGRPPPSETYTGVLHSKIVRRYVLSIESNRGPVGSAVGVMGRGFTPQDVVSLDGTPSRTVYASPNALTFYVPTVATGKNYQVTVGGAHGSGGTSAVGTFRVDPVNVTVSPATLSIATGERQSLTFTISSPAPAGGLLLDVTTDAPESVIMPEVIVPQGQTTASVTVEGGKAGSGSLFLKGYGGGDLTVPVTVNAATSGR